MNENGEPKQALQTASNIPNLDMPVVGSGGLLPRNYGELIEFAKMVAYSGMVPKSYESNVGAVLVAVQMGSELGLTPMSSIRSICVINGMPSVWGDGMLALVVSHPDCEDVIETLEGTTATCMVKRRGRSPVTRTFSWDDAKKANLDQKKGPWQQYPKRMLAMRARSFALRDAFPDVLAGVRATEEALDSVVDMGPAEYANPSAGPESNPLTAIPKAGVSSFGRTGRKDTAQGGDAQAPAGEPEKDPPAKGAANSEKRPAADSEQTPDPLPGVPAFDEGKEPLPPSDREPAHDEQTGEVDPNGQVNLDGSGF